MDNDIPITFDQYQRYGVAARAVESLRKNGQQFNLLEVGANAHKLLGQLLPNDHITYLDLEIPLEMQGQEDVMVGDVTELLLPDASFDIVVALDVFEHIPNESREAFLRHTCRTARMLTVIGAPFDFPSVVEAEREARDYWDGMFDHPYRWLAEHAINGLPNLDWTTQAVSSMGYHLHTLKHGDVNLWIAFIKGHFAKEYVETLRPIISMLDSYYIKNLFEQDFSPLESYRQFVFCSNDSNIIQTLKAFFGSLPTFCNHTGSNLHLELLQLLSTIAVQTFAQRDEQIACLNQALAERDKYIAALLNSRSWRFTAPFRSLCQKL